MPRIDPNLVPVVTDLERGLRELGIPFGIVGALVPELLLKAQIVPDGRLQLEDSVVFNMAGFSHVVPNAVSTPVEGGPTVPCGPSSIASMSQPPMSSASRLGSNGEA